MNDKLVGIICCLVAGFFFGTNYIPIKSVDCGDGFYFSLHMSIGIFVVGLLVASSPLTAGVRTGDLGGLRDEWGMSLEDIYPLAAVGGAAWMTGNLLVPTIIRRVGLGLGLTIWDLSNMMMGWATGMFGWFGVWREKISNVPLNVSGVVLCACSLFFFVAAGRADAHTETEHQADIAEVMCPHCLELHIHDDVPEVANPQDPEAGRADCPRETAGTPTEAAAVREASGCVVSVGAIKLTVSEMSRRDGRTRAFVGVFLALLTGCLFGYTFDLPTMLMQCGKMEYLADHEREDGQVHRMNDFCRSNISKSLAPGPTRSSPFPMTYVFSHFFGIMLMGMGAFLAYAVCKGRSTYAPCKLILPSMVSGVMWGIAQAAWFVANAKLKMSVAFPIISTLPGLVALACGFCLFGELATVRSRRLALAGISLRIPGVVMIALS